MISYGFQSFEARPDAGAVDKGDIVPEQLARARELSTQHDRYRGESQRERPPLSDRGMTASRSDASFEDWIVPLYRTVIASSPAASSLRP